MKIACSSTLHLIQCKHPSKRSIPPELAHHLATPTHWWKNCRGRSWRNLLS